MRNNPQNIFVQDGSKRENDWVRFYTEEEQPRVLDPKKGYLVTANNKLATDNLVNHISVTQSTHCRSHRIDKLLREGIDAGKKFVAEDFVKMQVDRKDGFCLLVIRDIN